MLKSLPKFNPYFALLFWASFFVGELRVAALGHVEKAGDAVWLAILAAANASLFSVSLVCVVLACARFASLRFHSVLWTAGLVVAQLSTLEGVVLERFHVELSVGFSILWENLKNQALQLPLGMLSSLLFAAVAASAAFTLAILVEKKLASSSRLCGWRPSALHLGALLALTVLVKERGDFVAANKISPETRVGPVQFPGRLFSTVLPRPKPLVQLEGIHLVPYHGREIAAVSSKPRSRYPNIVLVVADSLRQDMVTDHIAPRLTKLSQDSIRAKKFISSGNCSHISWISTFYSAQPYLWPGLQSRSSKGSPLMHRLRSLGYRMHLYTSQDMNAFDMMESIFGTDMKLLDKYELFAARPGPAGVAESDLKVFQTATTLLDQQRESGPVLAMLAVNSVHWGYSWPEDFSPPFKPYLEEVRVVDTFRRDKAYLDSVFMRYKNSVAFMDEAIGNFWSDLKAKGLLENTIFVVLGDHGEEFGEEGHLEHCNALSWAQVTPAFFLRTPAGWKKKSHPVHSVASLVDLWPTVFDLIGEHASIAPYVMGKSLVENSRSGVILAAGQGALSMPLLFVGRDIEMETEYSNGSLALLKVRDANKSEIPILNRNAEELREKLQELVGPFVSK